MKKTVFTLIVLSLVFCACSSSKNSAAATSKTEKAPAVKPDAENIAYTNLADFLRRKSSVNVTGVHPDIRLQIRGMNSLTGDTRPFIYLNNNPLGRDYAIANNYINPENIKRVEVLSSLAQLTRYGQEGHSGIIIIHTKN